MRSNQASKIEETSEDLESVSSAPYPSLGIDLIGCADECSAFFRTLTSHWPRKVFVPSCRNNRVKTEADLARYDIRFDELILADAFEAKAEVIIEKGILVYFDDRPEMLQNVPPPVNVMFSRNGGNSCFDGRP